MHDIDAQISKISGQSNYMEHLQKITGNIMNIDMAMYHEKHQKMVNCDSNIKKVLLKLVKEDEKILPLQTRFEQLSNELNLDGKTFYMHTKKSTKTKKEHKPKEMISPGYKPSELIKTDWFHEIKHMEKNVQKFLIEMFPIPPTPEGQQPPKIDYEKKTWEELEAEFTAHPELMDIKTIYDVRVANKSIFELFKLMKRFSKIIINILMLPMYDVKKTIESHWQQIEKIFKNKTFQEATNMAKPDDIVLILTQFIIAKYRATITGNNKHYVRLFFDAVGNDSFANMDGARFLEIMESIDLDKLDKSDSVYKFAMTAKTAMQKIAHNEAITPDLLKQFDEMFNNSKSDQNESENNQKEQERANQMTDGADIFNDDSPTNEQPINEQPINDSPTNENNEH